MVSAHPGHWQQPPATVSPEVPYGRICILSLADGGRHWRRVLCCGDTDQEVAYDTGVGIMTATAKQQDAYCFQCNEYRRSIKVRYATSPRGRLILNGTCPKCGSDLIKYADTDSATSKIPNAGENLLLRCPSCKVQPGKQCVERQPGTWTFGYPANIHRTRVAITTTAVKSAAQEAVRRSGKGSKRDAERAAERAAARKEEWKEAGICLAIFVFVVLTLGLGILLVEATRKK